MAKQTIEYTGDEMLEALRDVVRETLGESIRETMAARVSVLVDEAIRANIAPLVEAALTGQTFTLRGGYRYGADHQLPIEAITKRHVIQYLDERVYSYDNKSDLPSQRVQRTASNSNEPTRLEVFLRFAIDRYVDQHMGEKMGAVAKEFLEQRGGIEKAAREQMAALLADKFGLRV